MAGSRLEKTGSIFTRIRGLLRSGVMPEAKKPLWYDVYAAFPPLVDTSYQEPKLEDENKEDPIRPILYPEDKIRAKFYQVYGNGPGAFDLSRSNYKSTCQRFVEKYNQLQQRREVDEDKLFEETGNALMVDGFFLQKQGSKNVAPRPSQEPKDSISTSNTEQHKRAPETQKEQDAPELPGDLPKEGLSSS